MRAVQVARTGSLEVVERDVPEPARGEVRVRVEACGVCHSDSLTVEAQWPGLSFPRIPGHEVAGVIDALGAGVAGWRSGPCRRRLVRRELIGASCSVVGHAAGASIDLQDTLAFRTLTGVRAMIETMPLAYAPEAYARMMRGDARFRMVLTIA